MLTTSLLTDSILILTISIISLHTIRLNKVGRLQFFQPLFAFWGGFLIVNIYQPIVYYQTLIQWHDEFIIQNTLLVSLIAIAFLIFGYELPIGRKIADKIIKSGFRVDNESLLKLGFTGLSIGFICYFLIFNTSGGVKEWLSIGRGGTNYDLVSGYILQFAEFTGFGIWLIFYWAVNFSKNKFWTIFGVCLTFIYFYWLFYLGSRSRLILFCILIMGSYYLPKQKKLNFLFVISLFFLLFVAAKIQETQRSNFTNLSVNISENYFSDVLKSIFPDGNDSIKVSKGIDFNVTTSVIDLVPDFVPYNYGYGLLELFTRPIPRSIWPNKPYPSSEAVQGVLREAGLSESWVRDRDLLMGPSMNFVGYWFYVFGIIGVILGSVFTGILYRAVSRLHTLLPDHDGNHLLLLLLTIIGFTDAAATPLVWIFTIPITLLPLLLVIRRHKT